MDTSLSIGLSALLAAQKAIDTAGHNIANANTPNYSRQRVDMASLPATRLGVIESGNGVQPIRIESIRDSFVDKMLLAQDPAAGATARRSQLLSDIESLISIDPETGLGAAVDDFFSSFLELSRNPGGAAERTGVVQQAQTLVTGFRDLADRFSSLRRDLLPYAQEVSAHINRLSEHIAGLNNQIRDAIVSGGEANDLIDQRMTAIRELAELIPVEVTVDSVQRASVRTSGMMLVSLDSVMGLEVVADGGRIELQVAGTPLPFEASGGELGAIIDVANTVLPGYFDRLDALAGSIAREINQVHSTGTGLDGGFTTLASTTLVADAAGPLNQSALPYALAAGDLYVSVVDGATGEVTQTRIAIDPNADGLLDVAAALDGVAHLDAQVAGGRLEISADAGYTFDFTNRVVTTPGVLGTSTPTLTGSATIDGTDVYTFTADGPGTIGTTAGLTVTVRDGAGGAVAVLDVGDGYAPGDAVELAGGPRVSFSAGDVAAGDSFAVDVVGEPDEQGFLAALGLNTFFRGTTAAGLALEAAIVEDPGRIAAGRTDGVSDNTNALRLAGVQEAALEGLGGLTVDNFYAELIGKIGLDARMAQRSATNAQQLREAAQNQRDAVSAVNQDEEAVNLLRYQQLYSFAARYINTVDELMDQLMAIL